MKKGKNAGNSQVGEKILEESDSDSDSDDSDKPEKLPTTSHTIPGATTTAADKPQGLESADVVIGGEKIDHDENLSERQKKKRAAKLAKKKRDELVSKMTKTTQDGLGAAADMIERLTK